MHIAALDGEDKLGQPMLQYARFTDSGTWRFFYLPFFREQTFVGDEGRLRGRMAVDENLAAYTHPAQEWYPGVAVRYSHSVDEWDIGVAHFHGISREPTLRVNAGGALFPLYEIIDQTSLDVQFTQGSWLWKGEAIGRAGQGGYFGAMSGGLEYSFYDVKASGVDIGVLLEYHRDARPFDAPVTIFDHDVFTGMRIALNDVADTTFLGGVMVDVHDASQLVTLEASRRLSDHVKLELEARFLTNIDRDQVVYDLRKDDVVQLRLSYYF